MLSVPDALWLLREAGGSLVCKTDDLPRQHPSTARCSSPRRGARFTRPSKGRGNDAAAGSSSPLVPLRGRHPVPWSCPAALHAKRLISRISAPLMQAALQGALEINVDTCLIAPIEAGVDLHITGVDADNMPLGSVCAQLGLCEPSRGSMASLAPLAPGFVTARFG